MRPPRPPRLAPLLALIAASAALAGCVERALLIQSDPPGARVLLDGRDRGVTPLRVPYVHDGRFRVRLELDGYESVADEIVTKTGADAIPGIDFFAENAWPGTIRRVTERRYALAPLKRSSYGPEEMDALLRRAEAFRDRAKREIAEPGTPVPGGGKPPAAAPPPVPRETPPADR